MLKLGYHFTFKFYSHIQKLYTSDKYFIYITGFLFSFSAFRQINRIIRNSKCINMVASKDEWKMMFHRRVRSIWRSACVPLMVGVTLPETTCESWRDDRTSTQAEPENVCPRGQNRTSSGQLTPCSLWILQLPASYRYVPSDYLFPLLARLADWPANSSRVIDVTGSWLSDRPGDLLSRYHSLGTPLFTLPRIDCGKLLLHYSNTSRTNHDKLIWRVTTAEHNIYSRH